MKNLVLLLLGIFSSFILFVLLGLFFNTDSGPFASLTVILGIILGLQIIIFNKISDLQKSIDLK